MVKNFNENQKISRSHYHETDFSCRPSCTFLLHRCFGLFWQSKCDPSGVQCSSSSEKNSFRKKNARKNIFNLSFFRGIDVTLRIPFFLAQKSFVICRLFNQEFHVSSIENSMFLRNQISQFCQRSWPF